MDESTEAEDCNGKECAWWIHRCISMEKRILDKTCSGMLGLSSDDENAASKYVSDDFFGDEDVTSVEGGGVDESLDLGQDEDDDDRNIDAAVASGNLTPPLPPVVPFAVAPNNSEVNDIGDISGVATVIALPSMSTSSAPFDVRGALKRAASLVKAQKSKNVSNKNKERTLVAAMFVKLLEKDQSPSDSMATNMSMMLMKQMASINNSMDKHVRRERKGERRERKRHKKHHAKKRAKKAALKGFVDHGGKTGGVSSSNSSSSSSDSSNSSDSDSKSST